MLQDNKFIGVQPSAPSIASEIEGAPVSMPGGNDGADKTKMSGTPVASATVPHAVSVDLAGTPQAGQEVLSVRPVKTAVSADTEDDGGESKGVPVTDTDSAPIQTEEEKKRAEAVIGLDHQIKSIQDWLDAEENRPETPEQRKKRERKEKSKKIMAAVSDGLSALSNLFFTTRYAPNMYNHEKGSQLTPLNERIERMKAEREKKRAQHLNFSLKLGDIENERAKTLRELEAQQEAQKLAREKAERDAEQHRWLAALQDDKKREQKGKADKAEQDALSAQYEAENKPTELKLKNATETARAGSYKASAAASKASAVNSYASARAHDRSNPKEFTAWDEHGKPQSFRSEDAAILFAKQHGTYKETDETETTDTSRTKGSETTKTKTKKGGYAGKPDPTDMDDPTA